MVRITQTKDKYIPVIKFNENRYRISFDLVEIDENIATFSINDYSSKPTTEQIQGDVIKFTIQRYMNEGLTPPKPEDIDVSPYVID